MSDSLQFQLKGSTPSFASFQISEGHFRSTLCSPSSSSAAQVALVSVLRL